MKATCNELVEAEFSYEATKSAYAVFKAIFVVSIIKKFLPDLPGIHSHKA